MSKTRQHDHSEELRNRILEITQRIILEEGIDAVSIRRLAKELGYSVTVIYYYFHDKRQLLSCAVKESYKQMLASAKQPEPGLSPDEELRISFKNFIDNAMLLPHAYKSFILNSSAEMTTETSIFRPGRKEESPTLFKITSLLEAGIQKGLFSVCDVDLTAEVFWSAMFGLFFRLIMESHILPEERNMLIQRQLDILLKGISA